MREIFVGNRLPLFQKRKIVRRLIFFEVRPRCERHFLPNKSKIVIFTGIYLMSLIKDYSISFQGYIIIMFNYTEVKNFCTLLYVLSIGADFLYPLIGEILTIPDLPNTSMFL